MYGGSGKPRGGGGRKRSRLIPPNLPSSSACRLPPSRSTTSATAVPAASPTAEAEQSFSLVRENDLNFGMIIRLAPDLVDEIRRVEEHGGAPRIKFDTNANNSYGNVIEVGSKNFRFTWSREVGDLCDIYEERQSGEGGDALLVESGCAWRKLNVQRVLDESTKNLVKKRSEEAERQQKSRKAIILTNPAMKNQTKALAAAEVTKSFHQKKEPEFKKRKIDTPPVAIGGPTKPVYKPGLPLTTTATGRPSISPLPPPHSGVPASPSVAGSVAKAQKENIISAKRENLNKPTSGNVHVKPGRKGNFAADSIDLQTMLITLLEENPKGMSLKALEKATGDTIPHSLKKIEPIIKRIATYVAPGRYILKPGMELGSLKKPLSESGSSHVDNGQKTPAVVEKKHEDTTTPPNFAQKTPAMELEKPAKLSLNIGQEMYSFDNIDILNHSPDLLGGKKVSGNRESPAHSSSDGDSETDSSSDTESDVSLNSRQGPDEDVDIMTSDDDASQPKTQISEPILSTLLVPLRAFEAGPVQNRFEDKQDANGSNVDSDKNVNTENMFSERENIANVSNHDQSQNPERMSISKSRRGSYSGFQNENRHNKKKPKKSIESPFGKKNPVVLGKEKNLQREISVLELGKHRKPLPEEIAGTKRLEVESSLKEMESRPLVDENTLSFSKYEKEVPELNGPIKDLFQYKEYVQEYQEKYDSYCSLNKALESYRNEFYELGKDLENAKGRDEDKYYKILKQLYESYQQYGSRHKRMKKTFVVLHEELKHLKQRIQDFAASCARK